MSSEVKLAEGGTVVTNFFEQLRRCGLKRRNLRIRQSEARNYVEDVGAQWVAPSKNSARLGVHLGITHVFLKRTPARGRVSMFDVRGGVAPP